MWYHTLTCRSRNVCVCFRVTNVHADTQMQTRMKRHAGTRIYMWHLHKSTLHRQVHIINTIRCVIVYHMTWKCCISEIMHHVTSCVHVRDRDRPRLCPRPRPPWSRVGATLAEEERSRPRPRAPRGCRPRWLRRWGLAVCTPPPGRVPHPAKLVDATGG